MPETLVSVLHITRNLPPLQGGMERLNERMAQALAERYHVVVVGPEGSRGLLPDSLCVAEVPLRPLPLFLLRALWQSLRVASLQRPGIVLAGSGLTAPIAWLVASRSGAASVTYVHGLDLVVDSGLYRRLWLPFIRRMDMVLVNSTNTGRLALACGVPEQRIRILNPGTILPVENPQAAAGFRRDNDFGDRPLLLSVGRLTARKGLREFVEGCLPELRRRHPGLLLLVIGDDAGDALKAAPGSERARIAAAAATAGVVDAVRFMPPCDDRELSSAYEACDLHVFPVRELRGDVEGFGMVAIEAAAHGLPTVAFRSGGVPDAVVDGVTGDLVPADDYHALTEGILAWLPKCREENVRNRCRQAAQRWSWETFGSRLHQYLAAIVESGKNA